ncbi:MBL fold metallo-hydrolase [Oceanobacillus piezotolerans]|uniref:MBL fold metallo-hydrolase n=1 Tax=Oceanobacillus piezotolerans TaxID=2448030 RepID=A0A498DAR8_9BACI|nr:MBL fold metallo-hydrolase [Oceanobacillus piezotolerans]RLL48081.1 MBL fold metallo-hydrolase [Oceanobacillus piezotolerans]
MEVHSLPVGPIGTNCYLIVKEREVLIVDPGGEPNKIIRFIENNGYQPMAILLTHAHFDHIGAVDELRSKYAVEVYIHETEQDWLSDPKLNGSYAFIGKEIVVRDADQLFNEGELKIGGFSFQVAHTPGHSPGSVSFIFSNEEFIIGGDVLFREGIGRTDLINGDIKQLQLSIKEHFYTLPENYKVYPGHGPLTTIKHEKMNNPFVAG